MFYGRGELFFLFLQFVIKNISRAAIERVATKTNEKHKMNSEKSYRVLAHAEANSDRKAMNGNKHTRLNVKLNASIAQATRFWRVSNCWKIEKAEIVEI